MQYRDAGPLTHRHKDLYKGAALAMMIRPCRPVTCFFATPRARVARSVMLCCRTTPTLRGALRRLSTFEDVTPMTIADRVEQAAVRKGAFAGLRGRGKPLPEEDPDSQVHVAQLSKNIEGRVQM